MGTYAGKNPTGLGAAIQQSPWTTTSTDICGYATEWKVRTKFSGVSLNFNSKTMISLTAIEPLITQGCRILFTIYLWWQIDYFLSPHWGEISVR